MKCKYCDGVIAEGDRFCPHCGVACRELKAAVPVAPPPAPRVRKEATSSKIQGESSQCPPRHQVHEVAQIHG